MKSRVLSLLLLLSAVTFNCVTIQAQVTVGAGNEPLSVSVLEIISDYQTGVFGGLRLPQLTGVEVELLTAQIVDLSDTEKARALGLVVFNTTTACAMMWIGTEFRSLCGDIGPATMTFNCADVAISPILHFSTDDSEYVQGTALDPTVHYITIPVTVEKRGTYFITATTGNGYAFESTGNLLEVGDHTLTLRGQGTPINSIDGKKDTLSFQINGNPIACDSAIVVKAASTHARFTINCSSVTVNGTYVKGKSLDGSNTIEFYINVAEAGPASFSATLNGMNFIGGGTYPTGPRKVILSGSGTPTTIGSAPITITGVSSDEPKTCTTSVDVINVIPSKIKILGLGQLDYQPGSSDGDHSARAILSRLGNFGHDGIVKVDGIEIVNGQIVRENDLKTLMANEKPDIIVMGHDYAASYMTSPITRDTLAKFVQAKKGVLIAFTQDGFDKSEDKLINAIYGGSITVSHWGEAGRNYSFIDPGSDETAPAYKVLHGPFTDSGIFENTGLVGKWWGEDAATTSFLSEAPPHTTVLSVHSSTGGTYLNKPTAIIDNEFGFIWVGDGGFIVGNQTDGSGIIYPCKHLGGSPAVKTEYSHNGSSLGGGDGAYNSYFYANAIAWAIEYVNTPHP